MQLLKRISIDYILIFIIDYQTRLSALVFIIYFSLHLSLFNSDGLNLISIVTK